MARATSWSSKHASLPLAFRSSLASSISTRPWESASPSASFRHGWLAAGSGSAGTTSPQPSKRDPRKELFCVKTPPGCNNNLGPGELLRLCQPLHGLKQASHAWDRTLRMKLESWKMVSADADCMVHTQQGCDDLVTLDTFVNHLHLEGSDGDVNAIEKRLMDRFAEKQMPDDASFVGMQVEHDLACRTALHPPETEHRGAGAVRNGRRKDGHNADSRGRRAQQSQGERWRYYSTRQRGVEQLHICLLGLASHEKCVRAHFSYAARCFTPMIAGFVRPDWYR
jgi:hypothetical protein